MLLGRALDLALVLALAPDRHVAAVFWMARHVPDPGPVGGVAQFSGLHHHIGPGLLQLIEANRVAGEADIHGRVPVEILQTQVAPSGFGCESTMHAWSKTATHVRPYLLPWALNHRSS